MSLDGARRVPARHAVGSASVEAPGLTADQEQVLGALRTGERERFLIHGVTGSGKTEVYLRAVADTLARGRSAIVLVRRSR